MTIRLLLRRLFVCWHHGCLGRIVCTDEGIAWHCNTCGKISGWTSSETLKELAPW